MCVCGVYIFMRILFIFSPALSLSVSFYPAISAHRSAFLSIEKGPKYFRSGTTYCPINTITIPMLWNMKLRSHDSKKYCSAFSFLWKNQLDLQQIYFKIRFDPYFSPFFSVSFRLKINSRIYIVSFRIYNSSKVEKEKVSTWWVSVRKQTKKKEESLSSQQCDEAIAHVTKVNAWNYQRYVLTNEKWY